ncbi:hypothetical protein [Parvularcula sp. LCG005]|uniref:hypothetical protein n=1 Tax=Parvularcula sp. LCG005 TaxID=3078805 RepID=UPI00294280D7|nr:hypothetical protein [Parvularcula sp. LCG005]WOI54485.1 hypothetical protein RUI03_05650 [Parvularcula sp. LCG005]
MSVERESIHEPGGRAGLAKSTDADVKIFDQASFARKLTVLTVERLQGMANVTTSEQI